jgi:hypothetical protein
LTAFFKVDSSRLSIRNTDCYAETTAGIIPRRNGIVSRKALENSLLGSQFEGKPINFDKLVDFSIAREVAQEK